MIPMSGNMHTEYTLHQQRVMNRTPTRASAHDGTLKNLTALFAQMQRILDVLPAKPRTRYGGWGATAAIMLVLAVLQYGLAEYSQTTSVFLLVPGVFVCGFLFDRGSGMLAALLRLERLCTCIRPPSHRPAQSRLSRF